MRTLTISGYSDLTAEQWRRVALTAKNQVKRATGEVCQVGIGAKYVGGAPTERLAIRVYLNRKRQRVAASKRVPDRFRIRLRRADGMYDLVDLASDVESLSQFVPTRRSPIVATAEHRDGETSVGLLVRWTDRDAEVCWGFVVPAHFFAGTRLRVVSVRADRRIRFKCRRKVSARRLARVDAAVIEIRGDRTEIEEKLMEVGWIDSILPSELTVLSTRQVHRAVGRRLRGKTYVADWTRSFVSEEVFPAGFRLGDMLLDDCVRVGQAYSQTFQEGTSGACWRIDGKNACMQVGGKSPDFREGIGQPLDRIAEWLRSKLGETAILVEVSD